MRSSETRSINDFDSTIDLSGIPVDTRSPVMVTGATGYLGSWVTKGLLDAGVTVRAAVRDPQNTNKVAHLNRMAEQTPGTLRLFAGDLLQVRASGGEELPEEQLLELRVLRQLSQKRQHRLTCGP